MTGTLHPTVDATQEHVVSVLFLFFNTVETENSVKQQKTITTLPFVLTLSSRADSSKETARYYE